MKIEQVKKIDGEIEVITDDGKSHQFSETHGVLVVRKGTSGISLAKKLEVGDEILDINPEQRRKA